MRRSVVLAMAAGLLVVASSLPVGASGTQLTDISTNWARTQIETGVSDGYIAGYPDGTFRPNAPITRAEFYKMLTGALRMQPAQVQTGFAEQQATPLHWSFVMGTVQGAVSNDLLNPPDYGSSFSPDIQISRREMLMAAVRAVGQGPIVAQTNGHVDFTDSADYEQWLQNFAALGVQDGLITGYPDGSLSLNRNATRAEALVMVQRILSHVTMDLATVWNAPVPKSARNGAPGEPLWTWGGGTAQYPAVSDGSSTYNFPVPISNLQVLPAPGRMAWMRYQLADGTGVVARIAGGNVAEVVRYANGLPQLLATGDDGTLWFTDPQGKLQMSDSNAQQVALNGVGDPVSRGDVDWNGNFWGLGSGHLYEVTPSGQVTTQSTDLDASKSVLAFAMAEDGTAWVLQGNAPGAGPVDSAGDHLVAVQLQGGQTVKREVLLNRYYGGLGSSAGATLIGRSGPFLWVAAGSTGAQNGIYRFDTSIGEFVRMVPPRLVADGYRGMTAPEGDLYLSQGGKFWRVLS
ncbi:MAG: S-layer homology domain-containing protein [Mycobacterium leprae]